MEANGEDVEICRRGRKEAGRGRGARLPSGEASSSCITEAISSFSRCCHGERWWGGVWGREDGGGLL